jgi:uncharacterized protein (UPF0276 family)
MPVGSPHPLSIVLAPGLASDIGRFGGVGVAVRGADLAQVDGADRHGAWIEVLGEDEACPTLRAGLAVASRRGIMTVNSAGLGLGQFPVLDVRRIAWLLDLVDRFAPEAVCQRLQRPGTIGFQPDWLERNLDQVSRHLDRPIMIHAPPPSDAPSARLLGEVVRRTGCRLRLALGDMVARDGLELYARPGQFAAFLDHFPAGAWGVVDLAGEVAAAPEPGGAGAAREQEAARRLMWSLYTATLERLGALPTVVSWRGAAFDAMACTQMVRTARTISVCVSANRERRRTPLRLAYPA